MAETDWDVALDYLIARLVEMEADTLADEIREAVATLVIVPAEDVPTLEQSSKKRRQGLSEFGARARTPQERFETASQILVARLVEVPAIQARILKSFGPDFSEIQFKSDEGVESVDYDEDFVVDLSSAVNDGGSVKEATAGSEALGLLALSQER